MNKINLNKDQIQKVVLSAMGLVVLLYVYFNFFLGPLANSRNAALATIKEQQAKLDGSQDEIAKAAKLEHTAKNATARFAALKALNPEGAPIAWFPPRVKTFFANQQIDKAVARLDNSSGFKPNELSGWTRYNWLVELPQTDYGALGKAIAELENTEPLLAITKMGIHVLPEQPQFQKVDLAGGKHDHGEKMRESAFLLIAVLIVVSNSFADEPAPIEIKSKSSFKLDGGRNPFWPIGWKPSGLTASTDAAGTASDIPESAFLLSSIAIEKGARFAIINGKIMQEGQQFALQMGTSTYQLTLKKIADGKVILGRRDQEIVIQLRRK